MKTTPMRETGFGEKGIGEATKEGAVTKQYLADPKTRNIIESRGRETGAWWGTVK